MKFNSYIWSLYKNSPEGKKTIEGFHPVKEFPHEEQFLYSFEKTTFDTVNSWKENYTYDGAINLDKIFHHYFREKPFEIEDADAIFESWAEKGITYRGVQFIGSQQYEDWWYYLENISNALYAASPNFFFPFFFTSDPETAFRYVDFEEICNSFSIALPEVPKKYQKKERALYYLEICKTLYDFRTANNLTPPELIAFIYGFAPNVVFGKDDMQEEESLPQPSKVWYVAGGKGNFMDVDNASEETILRWQANIDTSKGDIIIMYCRSPRSYIHSIWRTMNDGFIDPFFHYYNMTYISCPIKVSPISWQEIKTNNVLSQSPLVKKNFQGVNGYPVSYKEYQEMIRLWEEKGMDSQDLPTIEPIKLLSPDIILKSEKDVEEYLIEPLLLKLKYKQGDWVRQMPIRMGRRHTYYPDYCVSVNKEGAEMIIEAKYSIISDKELQEAFSQAKSYARNLLSSKLMIAAKEGFWVFLKNGKVFDRSNFQKFSWNDVEDPDSFFELLKLVGKSG